MTISHIDNTQILTVIGPAKVDIHGNNEHDGPVISEIEAPTVSSIDPDTAECGGADLELVVTGTGFNEATKITFNGLDEPTKFRSDTEVTTGVKPSLFTVAATCPVGVRTGGMKSETMDFTFTDPAAARGRKR
jgi:hypothetical protein